MVGFIGVCIDTLIFTNSTAHKGMDMHIDTPLEVLHVVRLGPIKYLLRFTVDSIKKDDGKIKELVARMKAVNGDNLPRQMSVKNLIKWMGSLAGREAALFVQIAPFVLDGLVSNEVLQAWTTLSHFHMHAYSREFDHRADYADTMAKIQQKLVNDLAVVDPLRLKKPKLHLLVHLARQALEMGPPCLLAAEVFEAYNKMIRAIMFKTNRGSPSRDVGLHFMDWRTLRHVTALGVYLAVSPTGDYIWKRPGTV